ncbi:hypothetical protein A3715_00055 [Oleiphilus sp. HI0009]|nr:hypothetical protein A3715_00055 [Oleiphilus sp. HI0009]
MLFRIILLLFSFTIALPASAKFEIRVNDKNYTVRGYSINQLKENMNRNKQKYTRSFEQSRLFYDVDWKYSWINRKNGECHLMRLDLILEVDYVLPELHEESLLDKADSRTWFKFISAAEDFQDHHKKLIIKAFRTAVHTAKNHVNPSNNCSELERKLNKFIEDVQIEVKTKRYELNQEYRYGEISGAIL